MICPFKECCISCEKKEPQECKFCYIDEDGKLECGYY